MRFQFTESSPQIFDYSEPFGSGRLIIRVYLTDPIHPRICSWLSADGDLFPVSVFASDIALVITDALTRLEQA